MKAPALDITVNGEARQLASGATLQDLIEALGLGARRLAIAVNRDVVPRPAYGEHRLTDGDRIEILEAVGGG